MQYWKTTDFWAKLKDSCAIGGTLTTAGLDYADASAFWKSFVIAATLTGYVIGIWMTDKNQNGIADPFDEK